MPRAAFRDPIYRRRRYTPVKSFRTAAITFSGIELAHRIRKRQFALAYERNGRALSLKELWAQALSGKSLPGNVDSAPPPLMHQNSKPSPPRVRGPAARRGVLRHPRRMSFGKSLYLLVTPQGGRLWQYRYRFQGRAGCLNGEREGARQRRAAAPRAWDRSFRTEKGIALYARRTGLSRSTNTSSQLSHLPAGPVAACQHSQDPTADCKKRPSVEPQSSAPWRSALSHGTGRPT
jgi:hypothetical protein